MYIVIGECKLSSWIIALAFGSLKCTGRFVSSPLSFASNEERYVIELGNFVPEKQSPLKLEHLSHGKFREMAELFHNEMWANHTKCDTDMWHVIEKGNYPLTEFRETISPGIHVHLNCGKFKEMTKLLKIKMCAKPIGAHLVIWIYDNL